MTVPTLIPILSPGRHASPEQGGCFMEIASLLAGERWSDHPRSAHPALGMLARAVNDRSSDAGRAALVPMIPSVIGTSAADERVGAEIVALCCRRALGGARPADRFFLTHALRVSERRAADPRPLTWWRRRLLRSHLHGPGGRAIHGAVLDIARVAGPHADVALRRLLADAIALTRQRCGKQHSIVATAASIPIA